jgi:hypothetical protein
VQRLPDVLTNRGCLGDNHDMMKLIVIAVAGGASAALLGAGVTDASPSVWGKTYSDAKNVLSGAGYNVVVGTTVGDQLPEPDCLVTSQTDAYAPTYGPSQYAGVKNKTVTLALNCYPTPASEKQSGYSAANPDAKWLQNKNANQG